MSPWGPWVHWTGSPRRLGDGAHLFETFTLFVSKIWAPSLGKPFAAIEHFPCTAQGCANTAQICQKASCYMES